MSHYPTSPLEQSPSRIQPRHIKPKQYLTFPKTKFALVSRSPTFNFFETYALRNSSAIAQPQTQLQNLMLKNYLNARYLSSGKSPLRIPFSVLTKPQRRNLIRKLFFKNALRLKQFRSKFGRLTLIRPYFTKYTPNSDSSDVTYSDLFSSRFLRHVAAARSADPTVSFKRKQGAKVSAARNRATVAFALPKITSSHVFLWPETVLGEQCPYGIKRRSSLAGSRWNFTPFLTFLLKKDTSPTYLDKLGINTSGSLDGIGGHSTYPQTLRNITIRRRRLLGSFYISTHLSYWNDLRSVCQHYQNTTWRLLTGVEHLSVQRHAETLPIHWLILKFNRHQFFISLLDYHKRWNYFSLLPGLLLKYLEGKRKSAKKSLTTKLLLMRFLRKLLLISRVSNLGLIVKGVPLFLTQLVSFLNKPLPHTIIDPITKKTIDETGEEFTKFSFPYLTFTKNKSYGYQKTRKRGRIKRKIRRKIVRTARVIDES